MSKFIRKNKRVVIIGIYLCILSIYFWKYSRYPALEKKAEMGGPSDFSGLAFDVFWPLTEGMNYWTRIAAHFVNWCYTNKKGMTFGIFFAAAVVTLFSHFRKIHTKSPYLNAILGALMGAPLGLCANCSTPVGHGLLQKKQSPEMVMAMISSSPTLNLIVLSMLFAFFPFYIAAGKVLATLILLFLIFPWLVRKLKLQEESLQQDIVNPFFKMSDSSGTWWGEFKLTFKAYFASVWKISKFTLPLMALAGLMGSFAIEFLQGFELSGLNRSWTLFGVLAVIGSLLPVPMGFDVIAAQVLWGSGLDSGLTSTLLFSLGVFSIYPFLVYFHYSSKKLALVTLSSVVVTSILLGVSIGYYEDRSIGDSLNQIANEEQKNFEVVNRAIGKMCSSSFFKDKLVIESCQNYFIRTLAQEFDDSFCQLLSNPSDRGSCRELAWMKSGNFELCTQSKDPYSCKRNALKFRLLKNSIYAGIACTPEEKEDLPKDCLNITKIFRSFSAQNSKDCKSLYDFRFWGPVCTNLLATDAPNLSRSFAICDEAFNEREREECLLTVGMKSTDGFKVCHLKFRGEKRKNCMMLVTQKQFFRSSNLLQAKLRCEESSRKNKLDNPLCVDFYNFFEEASDSLVELARFKVPYFNSRKNIGLKRSVFEGEISKTQKISRIDFFKSKNILIEQIPYFERTQVSNEKLFFEKSGADSGLYEFSPYVENNVVSHGVAIGDVDGDLLPDILSFDGQSLGLFINKGHLEFSKLEIGGEVPLLQLFEQPQAVSLVDIDNDGWLDILFSTLRDEIFYILNDQHSFRKALLQKLPKSKRYTSRTFAIGDFDRNGFLDVYLGNRVPHHLPVWNDGARNDLFLNNNGVFSLAKFPGKEAPTHSVLASDIDQNGWLDLLEANDFSAPDYIFLNGSKGFRELTKSDRTILTTTQSSMSYDSADINNDMRFDLLAIDMTFDEAENDYCALFSDKREKLLCEDHLRVFGSNTSMLRGDCRGLHFEVTRQKCYDLALKKLARLSKKRELCDRIRDENLKYSCRQTAQAPINRAPMLKGDELAQVGGRNVMLVQNENGKFEDKTKDLGLASSFWGWSGKFADLDNDGWQDVYVVNGHGYYSDNHPNVFFRNIEGKKFVREDDRFGLGDRLVTQAFAYGDLDLDGDIDIVMTSLIKPLRLFENKLAGESQSIRFIFSDQIGNSHGIGGRVSIFYGENIHQVKEMKASGGVMSMDDSAIVFGVGGYKIVNRAIIYWSTGEKTELDRPLETGNSYLIHRSKESELARLSN